MFHFVLTYTAYSCMYFARKPFSVVKSTLQSDLNASPATLAHSKRVH